MQVAGIRDTAAEAKADLDCVEAKWREALSGELGIGDTPSIMSDLFPSIRAEAARRCSTQPVWREYEDLISDAVNFLDDVHSVLDQPESVFRSEISSSRTDRFGHARRMWRLWPVDAIERGAPEWRSCDGKRWRYPVFEDEIEGCIHTYLSRPWLSHPLVDWALLGGSLLDAASRLRSAIESDFASADLDLAINSWTFPWRGEHKLGTATAARLALVDSPEGSAPLRKYRPPFNWKHAAFCSVIGLSVVAFYPARWPLVAAIVLAWLLFDRWIGIGLSGAELRALADKIDRYRAAYLAHKVAWLATNAATVNISEVVQKVERAEALGLDTNRGVAALLAAIRSRTTARNIVTFL